MLKQRKNLHRGVWVILLAMGAAMNVAQADDDEGYGERSRGKHAERAKQSEPVNATFKAECSECHIAYPAKLLPAASWRKMMAGLDKHFGSDASLSEADNQAITNYLVKHAASRWKSPTAPLRITETAWFKNEHDSDEIPSSVWKNPKVKSPSNCGACHTRAESGSFDEDDIKMPR
ncbi:MAG: diheme cytochrome c [Gallionella sp.]